MGALDKIAAAKPSFGANYAKNGQYRFKVKEIRMKEGGFKGDSVITLLEVVTAKQTEGTPNAVGTTVDYVENLSDPNKHGGSRFKSFLMTLVGAEEHEFANPAVLAKFVNEKQAATGLLIDCLAYEKTTKAGGKITGFKWSHVELSDAEIAAIDAERAGLKLGPVLQTLQSA